jgi:hypothetical protein
MKLFYRFNFLAAGLISFLIYLITLAPTVIQIDSGELSAVQATLGIAHPTGYPLFTISGYLFSLIPLPLSKIYQLNLFAAILCSAGIIVFVLSSNMLLSNIGQLKPLNKSVKQAGKKTKKAKPLIENIIEPNDEIIKSAAFFGGLVLAFSSTFWFQSTSVEVYSLHILLINLVIYFLLKAFFLTESDNKKNNLSWFLFAVILALGFTNHMTTLLVIPAAAYLYFLKHGFKKESLIRIGLMIFFFSIVLIAFYLYLPVRASQNPLLNWGNPVDSERILRHVSGKQYQVWLFSSTEAAKKQLGYFFETLPREFGFSLLIIASGLIASFISARKYFYFTIVLFASTVLYSINYDIVDIDSYFILAYISLVFFAVYGFYRIFINKSLQKNLIAVISASVILIALQLYLNFGRNNQSNNFTFEDYTKELVNSVPENSIIFSYQWDFFISPAYYFQYVEGFRKDVVIIDKELLRRSWYYNQLEKNYPGLLDGIKSEQELFLKALSPFERDESFDANLLESLYMRIMTNLISTNIGKRNYFIAPEVIDNEMKNGSFALPEGFTLVPDLFLFKVVKGGEYIPAVDPDFKIRFKKGKDRYTSQIELFICSMLVRRALYEMQYQKTDRAKIYVGKILNDFPDYPVPPDLLRLMQ